MNDTRTTDTYTIDAAGKPVGRVASEAAKALRGKHLASFAPNRAPGVRVVITHSDEVAIHFRTMRDKTHVSYSGHPGGKKVTPIAKTEREHGRGELVRRAVYNMLPDNRLRDQLMKYLVIS